MVLSLTPWAGMASAQAADDAASGTAASVSSEAAAVDGADTDGETSQGGESASEADGTTGEGASEGGTQGAGDAEDASSSGAGEAEATEDVADDATSGASDSAELEAETDSDVSDGDQDSSARVTDSDVSGSAGGGVVENGDARRHTAVEPTRRDEPADEAAVAVECKVPSGFLRIQTLTASPGTNAWGPTVSWLVSIRSSFDFPAECTSYTLSLATYETQGTTWQTSGTQQFVDHDVVTLTDANRTATLSVDAPRCYGQVDLYYGSTIHDGGSGPGHAPVPHYPNITLDPIRAGFGGQACVVPSAAVVANPCPTDGDRTATVTLRVSEGASTRDFTVWAKAADGDYAQVGGTTTLPQGTSRESTVTVPLPEDTTVNVQVRSGDFVVTSAPIVTDCETPPPVTPSAQVSVAPCPTDGSARNATVTLRISEGVGSRDFTVWTKTGEGDFVQFGGTTTLLAGGASEATVSVPLPENSTVTLRVSSGDYSLTSDAFLTDCVPPVLAPDAALGDAFCPEVVDEGAAVELIFDNRESESEVVFTVVIGEGDDSFSGDFPVPAGEFDDQFVALVEPGVETPIRIEAGDDVLVDEVVTVDCSEETPPSETPPSETPPGETPPAETPDGPVVGGVKIPGVVSGGAVQNGTSVQGGALPRTGAGDYASLAGLSFALVLVGGGLLLLGRRRERSGA
jgi:hypothetical protein